MTARRKPSDSSTVDGSDKLEIVKWGMSTNVFRLALLVLVLSMHPLGRGFLSSFGFRFPDEQKIVQATEAASEVQYDVVAISRSVDEMKSDMTDLRRSVSETRANYAIIQEKIDNLSTAFTGFQVEFKKPKSQ